MAPDLVLHYGEARATAWRRLSPAHLLHRLRHPWHPEPEAGVYSVPVPIDAYDYEYLILGVGRRNLGFQLFQPACQIPPDHGRAAASSAARRARHCAREARIISARPIPRLYAVAGMSSGSGKPSLAARRRRMSITTWCIRRDSAFPAEAAIPLPAAEAVFQASASIAHASGFTPGRDSSSTQSRRTRRAPRRPLPCRRRDRSSL